MANVSIGVYSVRIYDSRMNEDIQIEGNEYSVNLSNVIKDYFTVMKRKRQINEEAKSLFIVDKIIDDSNDEICGIIKTGEYGYETELYDVLDSSKEVYKKPTNVAEVLPFVFKFYLKKYKNKKLYLSLQRFGQFGIKTKVNQELNKFFKEKYPEYGNLTIKIHDLISEQVINEYYKKEGLGSITLKRYELPSDFANFIKKNGADPKDFEIEYKIKPKKRGKRIPFTEKITDFFSKTKKDVRSVIEIKDNREFQYNDIEADLIINGKPKKLNFSNFLKFKVYEVVKVKMEENGHPNEEELLIEMERITKESINKIELLQ